MAIRRMLYHKEYAPRGRVFDMEKHSIDALVEQGYVDNPAKIGVNVWNPDAADRVAEIQRSYEAGEVGAIGDTTVSQRNPEMELAQIERDQAHERMRQQEDEIDHLKRQLAESKEKLADHRSMAAKIEEKRADVQSQVPADAPAPKKRGRPRKEPQPVEETAAPETDEDTDL